MEIRDVYLRPWREKEGDGKTALQVEAERLTKAGLTPADLARQLKAWKARVAALKPKQVVSKPATKSAQRKVNHVGDRRR